MTGKVMLEVRPPDVPSIRDEIEVEVAPLPESSGEESGSAKTPNINPVFVGKDDDLFQEENWDNSSVAKVVSSEESTEVYVSAENKKLNRVIKKAQRRSSDAVENVKNFYLEHIAFHAVLADLEGNGKVNVSNEGVESEDNGELKRACETVCGIMDDMFGVIVK